MPSIVFDRVTVAHPQEVLALNDVSLRIEDGELVSVVGPSGSGKSTLLRVIAGLTKPTGGRLLVDGEDVAGLEPASRSVAMVFQDHALYPHMSAESNLAFPLKMRHIDEPERSFRVGRTARAMGLARLLARRPKTLSLGQRNAVATGRALVRDPSILLLDEPLSNFDAQARLRGRIEIRRRHLQSGATTVYATNDQSEALSIADRTAVLNRGTIQQLDEPASIFRHPANLFVARFIGSPPMNVLSGRLEPMYPDYQLAIGADTVALSTRIVDAHPGLHELMGSTVLVGVRPENLHPAAGERSDSCFHGVFVRVEDQGSEQFAEVDLGRSRVLARLEVDRPRPGVGHEVELALDADHLHFFDPESGAAL